MELSQIVCANVLQRPAKWVDNFLSQHPNARKTALVVDHFFRTAGMIALMMWLPFSMPVNMAICVGGSLFYRLTVEKACAYKFSLPSMGGAMAFMIGKEVLQQLGVLLPLSLWLAYVLLSVHYEVEEKRSR